MGERLDCRWQGRLASGLARGRPWLRALVLLAAACGAGAAPQAPRAPQGPSASPAAEAAPPRVNLAVEWRWSEAALRRHAAPSAPAAPGPAAVVTSTVGSTAPPQGQVTVRAGAPAAPAALPALPARVVVANGGLARVRLAEAVPLQAVQVWQEPAGSGAALIPGWAEAVQALELRVRWPGGRSAADVELEVEQALPPASDGSTPGARRERLATRAWVPLGEWVTVAAWGGATGGAAGGAAGGATPVDATTLSTSALEARVSRVLQLRLSALQQP